MRIGVYGGSFNPPHTGHTLAAAELISALELDRLLVMPAAQPPHKALAPGSPSPEQRLALCQAAFGPIPGAEVCDLEMRREGKSYTVDTLTLLRQQYPEDELFLIMGTDMLLSFRSWREPERIAALATLAVMHREDDPALWGKVRQEAEALKRDMQAHVLTVENRCIQVSSTTVRRLIVMGAPGYLDQPVEALIRQNGWYLSGADLKGLPFDRLREISLSLHDEKRRAHVVGTCETAGRLAMRWGEDPDKARRAGILHDITKALGPKEQLHICKKYAMMLTKVQQENPKLLHAKTGAVIAKEIFGEEAEVVSAIWWHTTGRAAMTTLEQILYIADYMEPNRDFPGVEELRELADRDLNRAVLLGLDQALSYLRERNRIIDPDSQQAWDYYRNLSERSNTP